MIFTEHHACSELPQYDLPSPESNPLPLLNFAVRLNNRVQTVEEERNIPPGNRSYVQFFGNVLETISVLVNGAGATNGVPGTINGMLYNVKGSSCCSIIDYIIHVKFECNPITDYLQH